MRLRLRTSCGKMCTNKAYVQAFSHVRGLHMQKLFQEAQHAYDVAVQLASEPRFTGSEGEAKAREFIVRELKNLGYDVKLEPFKVKVYQVKHVSLEVLEPRIGSVECTGVGFSGETGEDGVEGDLFYIEGGDPILEPSSRNWIGLASTRPDKDAWRRLVKKALGLLIAESSPHRELSRVEVPVEWRERFGNLPAVYVRYNDAVKLLDAKRVRLTLLQDYREVEAFNIVAEKKGVKYPDEIIYVTAHLDSVYGVKGAVDNAGGSALTVAIAKALASSNLKRSIRFVLFSGEELGLRGSLAYVEAHKDELKNAVLVLNLDVHGGAVGSTRVVVTGSKSLRHSVEFISKKLGVKTEVSEDVMSSDSASFARLGVPSVNIFRSSGANVVMHTEQDSPELLHPMSFELPGLLTLKLIDEIADAEEVPFEREISDDVKKKVEEYFKKRLGIFE
ncbi:MAG: M28 family peptidase [Thermofilaceae archaeon]|nr:M28 family peptidase [Thermofilaceae archaeon]MCX8181234.1 M28 family peptidase [Thermofilaceae archaeon]